MVEFEYFVSGHNGVQQVQPQNSGTDAMYLNKFVIDWLYEFLG
jgi:hypothetical protein